MDVDIMNTYWDTDRFSRKTCFQKGVVPFLKGMGSATGGGRGDMSPATKMLGEYTYYL